MDLRTLATQKAGQFGVDPNFVHRIIRQESRWNPSAVSPVGAIGLMQVMPATGRDLGVSNPQSLYDPLVNVTAGVRYLKGLLGRFGDEGLAAAAYNAGPGRVGKLLKRHGDSLADIYLHLPKETRGYVRAIASGATSLPMLTSAPAVTSIPLPATAIEPQVETAQVPFGRDNVLSWVLSGLLGNQNNTQDLLPSLFSHLTQSKNPLDNLFSSRLL